MAKIPASASARRLRVLRAARNLTQAAIADRTGLTQTRYWQIEHGEGAPLRPSERAAIARVLAVPASAIAWPKMTPTRLQLERAARAQARLAQRAVAAGA